MGELITTNETILVVGGGFSGMTSAIEASKAGYPVSIVEKNTHLGGNTAQFYKRVPGQAPYSEPIDTGIAEMINSIENDSNITLHLNPD